jgi:hypothetical protein
MKVAGSVADFRNYLDHRKQGNMFKRTIQILAGVALAVQLTGCFYGGHDDRWHHDHDRAVVVVHG